LLAFGKCEVSRCKHITNIKWTVVSDLLGKLAGSIKLFALFC
jgi:hypothetical protein